MSSVDIRPSIPTKSKIVIHFSILFKSVVLNLNRWCLLFHYEFAFVFILERHTFKRFNLCFESMCITNTLQLHLTCCYCVKLRKLLGEKSFIRYTTTKQRYAAYFTFSFDVKPILLSTINLGRLEKQGKPVHLLTKHVVTGLTQTLVR